MKKNRPKFISLIITTYNHPLALEAILLALNNQHPKKFEVIIADDGSTSTTKNLIENLKDNLSFPLHHVWQEDNGFQAAKIRNKAAIEASGDYFIFLDGDCIPGKKFIKNHLQLAEKNFFVVGNRVLLSKNFSEQVLIHKLPIFQWSLFKWISQYHKKIVNRVAPILLLPLGKMRKLRYLKWQGAKSCNLGIWREDFWAVNGFEEHYEGWGFEDSDLIIRLFKNKIYRKDGHFGAPVFHLWHVENDRSRAENNFQRLKETSKNTIIKAQKGIDQYLKLS